MDGSTVIQTVQLSGAIEAQAMFTGVGYFTDVTIGTSNKSEQSL
ncbi:hypothetical protein [Vibrio mediterranei]|jgi:predicted DNA-binding protein with PD1-like motif|nr:hypothetical protein [Vibrio mediterranei]